MCCVIRVVGPMNRMNRIVSYPYRNKLLDKTFYTLRNLCYTMHSNYTQTPKGGGVFMAKKKAAAKKPAKKAAKKKK